MSLAIITNTHCKHNIVQRMLNAFMMIQMEEQIVNLQRRTVFPMLESVGLDMWTGFVPNAVVKIVMIRLEEMCQKQDEKFFCVCHAQIEKELKLLC